MAGFEEVAVGARDELSKRVGRLGLGQSESNRVLWVVRFQDRCHLLQASPCFVWVKVGHRANKLVPAVADDDVVGAEIGAKRVSDDLQEGVAGEVSLAVV